MTRVSALSYEVVTQVPAYVTQVQAYVTQVTGYVTQVPAHVTRVKNNWHRLLKLCLKRFNVRQIKNGN